MTTLTPAQEAVIAAPDPVFASDGSAVKLYEGALTLQLLPGCSADRDDDQPSIYGAFVPLTVELAQAILKNQNTNRNVSDAAVARYADDMKAGHWDSYEPRHSTGLGRSKPRRSAPLNCTHRCRRKRRGHP